MYAAPAQIAQNTSTGVDLSVLGNYGVLGLVAAALLVYARNTIKRELDRGDRLEAEVQRLNAFIQDEVVPALVSATHAVNEAAGLIRDLHAENRKR